MTLREIKAQARRDLHEGMKVAASYYETLAAEPRLIYIRVHTKFNLLEGDLKGTNLSFAEKEVDKPKLLFMRDEVAMPTRNAVVVVSAEEGYRVGQTEPADGLTIRADVVQLKPAELVGLTLPLDIVEAP